MVDAVEDAIVLIWKGKGFFTTSRWNDKSFGVFAGRVVNDTADNILLDQT